MTEIASHSEPEAQKRRSTRIVQAVPVTVAGVDALGRPFRERTSTATINCHGCRYQSKHYVLKNMWVMLEVPHPEPSKEPRAVRGRVTWIQRPRTVRELFHVGVELEVPGNIWGIAFPPENWFPFPETPPQPIPGLGTGEPGGPVEEWMVAGGELRERGIYVVPSPGGPEASVNLARQVARLVVEARQQVQEAVRDATAKAITAETQPLLSAIHNHFTEAAEKYVRAAVNSCTEQVVRQALAKVEETRRAETAAQREAWRGEAERQVKESGGQLAAQLAEVQEGLRSGFRQELEAELKVALDKLNGLVGEIGASVERAETSAASFRRQLEDWAEASEQRWEEALEEREEDARLQLEKLSEAAQKLQKEIASATAEAQSGWRGRLDADLAAAASRWQEKVETSLDAAARQAAERLTRHSQAAAENLERELGRRATELKKSLDQTAADVEAALGSFHTALDKEVTRARGSLAETQQAVERLEKSAAAIGALSESTADDLKRRFDAILAAAVRDLDRRTEAALSELATRLQPALEALGQQALAGLTTQLEEKLTAQFASANAVLEKLSASQQVAEEAERELRQRLLETSRQYAEDSLSHARESLEKMGQEFREAGQAALTKWLAELEAKATDTSHSTYEALFKAAEWYEKKIQAQMQAAIDKGLEQAANSLRERAGEVSARLAAELDHYSRSYFEHTQDQVEEAAREAVERARGQLAQEADTTAASFTDDARRLAEGEFERFRRSLAEAAEQTATRLEATAAQARSQIESEAQTVLGEFHRTLHDEIRQGLERGQSEFEARLAPLREAWQNARQAAEREFRQSLTALGAAAIEAQKDRLENVSNSWLVATGATLTRQSEETIAKLAAVAEQQLRESFQRVFSQAAEAMRERLLDLSVSLAAAIPPSEKKKK